MSEIDEIRERQKERRRRCELVVKGTDIPLPQSIADIDYLLAQVQDGGVEERQLIQDLASFPFDVLMDENAPRVGDDRFSVYLAPHASASAAGSRHRPNRDERAVRGVQRTEPRNRDRVIRC